MNDDRPIIIVKKRGKHGGHHGGAWKVAYADFVTAMMAFFLVMWILGLNQDTRKAIAAYFNDPLGFQKSHAGGTTPMNVGRQTSEGRPAIMPSSKSILKEAESAAFKAAMKALEEKIRGVPEFKAIQKYIVITLTAEGLRIELMEGPESLFFETGSAKMKPQTERLLRIIARELRNLPQSVVLEGHTDARPYAGGLSGYSNWELSSDRANSARRAMVSDLRTGQIAGVRGYADRHLRNPADPNHFSNRRISILVEYSDRARSASGAGGVSLQPPAVDLREEGGEAKEAHAH